MRLGRAIKVLRHSKRAPEIFSCVRATLDWPWLIGGYLGLSQPDYPRDLRLRSGSRLTLESFHDLVTAWVVLIRQDYFVDSSCTTIVDAGANIGMFSLFAAARAPSASILALEPFPSTYERLERNVFINALQHRITMRPWALAASSGERHMDESAAPSQSRGMLSEDDEGGVGVEALSLGDLFQRADLRHIDLLKMDIEGSEHEVFLDTPPSVLGQIGAIALEYHPNQPKGPLFAHLRAAGFQLWRDVAAGDDPNSGVAHFRQTR